MSKNIAVSDEVYRLLKREKGDRSFSDVIRERFEESGNLADVTGVGIIDGDTYRDVTDDIEQLSQGTVERVDDESP